MENNCLYCQQPLKGRADKKFCDDQCKSAYHNKNQHSKEVYIKTINKQLRANRTALRKACPAGKATVRKDFLIKLGMNLNISRIYGQARVAIHIIFVMTMDIHKQMNLKKYWLSSSRII